MLQKWSSKTPANLTSWLNEDWALELLQIAQRGNVRFELKSLKSLKSSFRLKVLAIERLFRCSSLASGVDISLFNAVLSACESAAAWETVIEAFSTTEALKPCIGYLWIYSCHGWAVAVVVVVVVPVCWVLGVHVFGCADQKKQAARQNSCMRVSR